MISRGNKAAYRVLLISDFDHFLLQGLKDNLRRENIYVKKIVLGKLGSKSKIIFVLTMALAFFYTILFSGRYDCISYHYATKYMVWLDKLTRIRKIKRVCTIWGSELSRASRHDRNRLVSWYQTLDGLSSTNTNFTSQLEGLKLYETSFGLNQLNFIEQIVNSNAVQKNDLINVVIGTNGSPNQQHLDILEQIALLPFSLREKYHFIFPMTYGGSSEYRDRVKEKTKHMGLSFEVVESILSDEELALLRVRTDILIQLQESDQLSGAMLEALFAGSYVVTGTWLPYKKLDDLNIVWKKIPSLKELPSVMSSEITITNEEKLINREIISQNFSWERKIENWRSFLIET